MLEIETNGSLTFLDILMTKKSTCHHLSQKHAVLTALINMPGQYVAECLIDEILMFKKNVEWVQCCSLQQNHE